ncbi:single-stranded DNA-binding protein [bacterium]|nr:single-stranded DNA-binding protein [bacterium]
MESKAARVEKLITRLNQEFAKLRFSAPWVYNPWEYAAEAYLDYWRRYGQGQKELMLLGMNPGPWGMAQTGIPFGEVELARDWLGIRGRIGKPAREHPQRPIQGWDCKRSEVSGRRLWGYLREKFPKPEDFFKKAYVANYCPLVFMEESGRNLTPDKLPKAERTALLALCDQALLAHLEQMQPQKLVGVGKWAQQQAQALVDRHSLPIQVLSIPHPSPANPGANRGWGNELGELL